MAQEVSNEAQCWCWLAQRKIYSPEPADLRLKGWPRAANLAASSHSGALEVQSPGTYAHRTSQRHGDLPSARPRAAAGQRNRGHKRRVKYRAGIKGRVDVDLRLELAHRRDAKQERRSAGR